MPETLDIPDQGLAEEVEIVDSLPDEEEGGQAEASPYTGEVPARLYDQDELVGFIEEEVAAFEGEMSDYYARIARWHEVYEAPPAEFPKDWPFENSANLTVPVVKEVVNTITSQLTQTLLSPTPAWILKDIADEWAPFKHQLEQFMDLAARRELDLDEAFETGIQEAAKYGTAVIETGYDYRKKKYYRQSFDGSKAAAESVAVKDGPIFWNVPLEDYLQRLHETDTQEAKWCGKRLRMSESQLKNYVGTGKFLKESVERILGAPDEDEDEVTEKREELEEREPKDRGTYEILELFISWNLDDGDDLDTEIIVYYHPESQEILSVRFMTFWHRERPFTTLVFMPKEYQWVGDGLCGMLEALQDEISTIHNQRLDNSTVANARMVVVKKAATSLKPGDALYGRKVILAEDPTRDIQPFQLGEIYPSTIHNEEIARRYVERLSGMSEANSRGGFPVTRTTTGSQELLLQEQRRRFDQTVRKLRKAKARLGNQALSLYFQYGAGDKPSVWMGEKGLVIEALFRLPRRASEMGLGIEANAPTSALNKQTQRQNSIAMFNLITQMYERFIPLAQMAGPEAMAQFGNALVGAAKTFMFDALEQFDQSNPEDILAGLTVLERILPSPEDFGGLESIERSEETAEVLNQLERLEGLLRRSGGGEERRAGLPQNGRRLRDLSESEGVPRADRENPAAAAGAFSPFAGGP